MLVHILVFFSDLDGGVSEEIHNTASVQGYLQSSKQEQNQDGCCQCKPKGAENFWMND